MHKLYALGNINNITRSHSGERVFCFAKSPLSKPHTGTKTTCINKTVAIFNNFDTDYFYYGIGLTIDALW